MLIENVKQLSASERLIYWATEREKIRLRRQMGQSRPWTSDEILDKFRFCNVRRMDDAVSRWLLENWYGPYKDHKNMAGAVCLARMFNNPNTLAGMESFVFVSNEPNWTAIKAIINQMSESGLRVFNAAYIVSTSGHKANKIDWVVDRYVKPAHEYLIPGVICRHSMEKTAQQVESCYGFSSFMAGQVVADLRWALTGRWDDRMTWAPLGPGSRRGLNRLYGFTESSHQKEEEFRGMLENAITMLKDKLPNSITSRLEAHDYQNCLCEWDKYERMLWGQGKPKQLYKGK